MSDLGLEVIEHPPYSLDVAPSDFLMFGGLKEALKGRKFPTDEDVTDAVQKWLNVQSQTFFLTESEACETLGKVR
jgi:histone-lysine N-methyltransferase SETMAR